jgi:hypothetical protein
MDRSLLPGQRKLISVIDLLVIAEMGEFSDLNLNPDKYETAAPPKNSGQPEMRCLSNHTRNHSFSATPASGDLLE